MKKHRQPAMLYLKSNDHSVSIIELAAMNVAIEEKILAIAVTHKTFKALFLNAFLKDNISSLIEVRSLTLGLLAKSCAKPANQPAANKGDRELIGAATKAVRMAKGCPKTSAVPSADMEPLMRIHDTIESTPLCALSVKVKPISNRMVRGINHPQIDFFLIGALDMSFIGNRDSLAFIIPGA